MNSASNPRKFAEKIAKLHQKEVEQTMAFEQIMAEVIVATRGPSGPSTGPASGSLQNNNSQQQQTGATGTQNQHNSTQQHNIQQHKPLQQNQSLSYSHQQQMSPSGVHQTQAHPSLQQSSVPQPVPHPQHSNHHLHINSCVANNCRAESLPNVTYVGSSPSAGSNPCQNHINNNTINVNNGSMVNNSGSGIDLQSALSNLEEMRQGRAPVGRERGRHASPSGSGHHLHQVGTGGHQSRGHSGGRSYAGGHHSGDHHRLTSPYATPYLSPPDTWRRTNSDSALHQSYMMAESANPSGGFMTNDGIGAGGLNSYSSSGSPSLISRGPTQTGSSSLTNINALDAGPNVSWDPGKQQQQTQQNNLMSSHHNPNIPHHMSSTASTGVMRMAPGTQQNNMINMSNNSNHQFVSGSQNNLLMTGSSDVRPKSCDVPGITIYPSQDPCGDGGSAGGPHHHIPISSNTGSLPDLTSFHFPAPLSTPIDTDDSIYGGGNNCAMSGMVAQPSPPASNSQSSSVQYNQTSPGSPFGGRSGPPTSPYSVNSNNGSPSPFSPQSPCSASGFAYSPPPPNMTNSSGGIQQQNQNSVTCSSGAAAGVVVSCNSSSINTSSSSSSGQHIMYHQQQQESSCIQNSVVVNSTSGYNHNHHHQQQLCHTSLQNALENIPDIIFTEASCDSGLLGSLRNHNQGIIGGSSSSSGVMTGGQHQQIIVDSGGGGIMSMSSTSCEMNSSDMNRLNEFLAENNLYKNDLPVDDLIDFDGLQILTDIEDNSHDTDTDCQTDRDTLSSDCHNPILSSSAASNSTGGTSSSEHQQQNRTSSSS